MDKNKQQIYTKYTNIEAHPIPLGKNFQSIAWSSTQSIARFSIQCMVLHLQDIKSLFPCLLWVHWVCKAAAGITNKAFLRPATEPPPLVGSAALDK